MTATLPHELRPTWLGSAIVATVDAARRTTNAIWPLFDLFVRLWLAQTFFVSGLLKLASWDTALYLAEFEYPVSWLAPCYRRGARRHGGADRRGTARAGTCDSRGCGGPARARARDSVRIPRARRAPAVDRPARLVRLPWRGTDIARPCGVARFGGQRAPVRRRHRRDCLVRDAPRGTGVPARAQALARGIARDVVHGARAAGADLRGAAPRARGRSGAPARARLQYAHRSARDRGSAGGSHGRGRRCRAVRRGTRRGSACAAGRGTPVPRRSDRTSSGGAVSPTPGQARVRARCRATDRDRRRGLRRARVRRASRASAGAGHARRSPELPPVPAPALPGRHHGALARRHRRADPRTLSRALQRDGPARHRQRRRRAATGR